MDPLRRLLLPAAAAVLAVAAAIAAPLGAADAAGPGSDTSTTEAGRVTLIQAVPGTTMSISIDGRSLKTSVAEGGVIGPVDLSPGTHQITFAASSGAPVASTVAVAGGTSTDVVIHRPAAVNGDPVVNSYQARLTPLGPGKARLLLAHTATVAPADVDFDGTVVFRNIANGEFAQADVPSGDHQVALLPAGQHSDPILGPIKVSLEPQTATMVYAVGRPQNGSMKVIAHTVPIAADGSKAPSQIKTGSAGLVGTSSVRTFSVPTAAKAMALAASAAGVG